MLSDVRLVDEEGTPMSTPNTSGDDESGDEVRVWEDFNFHQNKFRVILMAE